MDKEVLSVDILRDMNRRNALDMLWLIPLFLTIAGMFFLMSLFFSMLAKIVCYVVMALCGAFCLLIVAFVVRIFVDRKWKPIVVKAKQTRKKQTGLRALWKKLRYELDEDYSYVLQFEYYGEYILPDRVYGFSEYNEMTGKELWDATYPDDEFYLVLNKKNRIIAAFHCNNFEYVDELTQHTIVNGQIQK